MSAAALGNIAVLGNVRFERSSTQASNVVTWDAERERRAVARAVASVCEVEVRHKSPVTLVHRDNSVLPFRRPSVSLDLEEFQ